MTEFLSFISIRFKLNFVEVGQISGSLATSIYCVHYKQCPLYSTFIDRETFETTYNLALSRNAQVPTSCLKALW